MRRGRGATNSQDRSSTTCHDAMPHRRVHPPPWQQQLLLQPHPHAPFRGGEVPYHHHHHNFHLSAHHHHHRGQQPVAGVKDVVLLHALIVSVQNIETLPYLLLAFLASLPLPSPSPSMRAFPHPERTIFRIRPSPPPSSSSLLSPGPSTRSSPSSLNSIRGEDVQVCPPLPEAQRRQRLPRDVEPAQPGSLLDE
jgi:hypothetical protein